MAGSEGSGRLRERIANLIRRATHPTTPIEEARTSAVIALKTMVDAGLTVGGAPVSPPPAPERAAKRAIRAQHASWCRVCGNRCEVGALVYWRQGEGIVHRECGENW